MEEIQVENKSQNKLVVVVVGLIILAPSWSLSSIAGSQRLKTRRVGKNTGTHGKRDLFLLPENCSLDP